MTQLGAMSNTGYVSDTTTPVSDTGSCVRHMAGAGFGAVFATAYTAFYVCVRYSLGLASAKSNPAFCGGFGKIVKAPAPSGPD